MTILALDRGKFNSVACIFANDAVNRAQRGNVSRGCDT